MCDVAAIGPVVSAIGSAQKAQAANKAARRDYEYKLKIRKQNWMRKRSIYQTKLVQFDKGVDESNIAAQRAYTETQISMNRAVSAAMLQNQADFKKILDNEGEFVTRMAGRGIQGKSVGRQLVFMKQQLGMRNAARARALTTSGYDLKRHNEGINRQLKSVLNREYSKVAITPYPELAPPPPVYQNVGMNFMLDMAGAVASGMAEGGMFEDSKLKEPTKTETKQAAYNNRSLGINYFTPTYYG